MRVSTGGGLAAVQVWAGRGPVPDGAAVSSAVTSQGKGEFNPSIKNTQHIFGGLVIGDVAVVVPLLAPLEPQTPFYTNSK